MKMQMPKITFKHIKKTLNKIKCCNVVLEDYTTVVLIMYHNKPLEIVWILLLEREGKEKSQWMWASFEDKGLLIENSNKYRMIKDFSLSSDTRISPVLQKNLDSRNKQAKLRVWIIGKKGIADVDL